MSYTEIIAFHKDTGTPYMEEEIKNSWRGAMNVWSEIEKRYLPEFIPDYYKELGCKTAEDIRRRYGFTPTRTSSIDTSAMQEIWDLVNDKKLTLDERITLCTTFDKCLVKRENIQMVIDAFRNFNGDENCSLNEQADILEEFLKDENCMAVGWNQTSVNCCIWTCFEYDEENEEEIPYNCITGDYHFWLEFIDDENKEK